MFSEAQIVSSSTVKQGQGFFDLEDELPVREGGRIGGGEFPVGRIGVYSFPMTGFAGTGNFRSRIFEKLRLWDKKKHLIKHHNSGKYTLYSRRWRGGEVSQIHDKKMVSVGIFSTFLHPLGQNALFLRKKHN